MVERTREPTRRLHELTAEALARGRGARRARGTSPTLEDVYLRADRVRLFLHEVRTAQLLFWRNREAAFFTFFLPIVFFLIFGYIYGNDTIAKEHIRAAPFLEAGMIGYGVASTAFAGLAITMVMRRERGVLKRDPRDAAAARHLPARRAPLDVRRLPDRGRADHRARPVALRRRRARAVRSRCSCSCCSAPRASRRWDSASRRSSGRPRARPRSINFIYLPMAIISGTFFTPKRYPAFLRGDRRRLAADVLHEADARGDGSRPPPLDGLARDLDCPDLGRDRARRSAQRLPLAAAGGLAIRRIRVRLR